MQFDRSVLEKSAWGGSIKLFYRERGLLRLLALASVESAEAEYVEVTGQRRLNQKMTGTRG